MEIGHHPRTMPALAAYSSARPIARACSMTRGRRNDDQGVTEAQRGAR